MSHKPASAMAPAIKIVGSVTITVPMKVATAANTFMAAVQLVAAIILLN